MAQWKVVVGDTLETLRLLPDNSFDSMCTDPPAGIGFMQQRNPWDSDKGGRDQWIAWLTEIMKEALRVVKPGGHAFVWGLPRTAHWTAFALEDSGWDLRDRVAHLHAFGTGFPKSKTLADGVGTALKPGYEIWLLARKPVEESITANYARHGTGGLNINACRVNRASDDVPGWHKTGAAGSKGYQGEDTFRIRDMSAEEIQERCGDKGRWPPNLLLTCSCGEPHDDPSCPVAEMDRQSGERPGCKSPSKAKCASIYRPDQGGYQPQGPIYGDTGGASRFFPTFKYQAKPSRSERELGLEEQADRTLNRVNPGGIENDPRWAPVQVKNNHPCVKSLSLMRWLCSLITPPNGYILDPFLGSGSTGAAAVQLGYGFYGCDKDPEYVAIAESRIRYWEAKAQATEE